MENRVEYKFVKNKMMGTINGRLVFSSNKYSIVCFSQITLEKSDIIAAFKLKAKRHMKVELFNTEYETVPTEDGIGFTLKEVKKEKSYRWEDCAEHGFYINNVGRIDVSGVSGSNDRNVFYSRKQAKSALAFAQLTHIMNKVYEDCNWWPDWSDDSLEKYCIVRRNNSCEFKSYYHTYAFLSFPNNKISQLVYEQNKQLIHDYLMID